MEKNTVILDLNHYNELRDFYEKINHELVVVHEEERGFLLPQKREIKFLTQNESLMELVKYNSSLYERFSELKKENENLKKELENKKSIFGFKTKKGNN